MSVDFEPLSVDQVRERLAGEHQILVGDDDPILMSVTMHRMFAEDHRRLAVLLLDNQVEALGKAVSEAAATIKTRLEDIDDELVKASLQNTMATIRETASILESADTALKRHRRGMVALTAANWCVLAIAIGLFLHISQ